jgi:hypothetical protein
MGKTHQTIKGLTSGTGAGLVCGLLGAGGGALLVPLLRDWMGLESKKAMATSVFCVAPLCAVSAVMYALRGKLPWPEAWPYAAGGLAGGFIAGFLFKKTAPDWLRRGFGVLLLLGSFRTFINWETGLRWDGMLPSAAAGAGTGILSGFGLGGGVILLIWMTAVGGLDQHAAQGSNLLYFPLCAAGSMPGHIKNKQIVWREGLVVLCSGLPTAILGAFLANRIDAHPLRIGFGILTAIIGLREVTFGKIGKNRLLSLITFGR